MPKGSVTAVGKRRTQQWGTTRQEMQEVTFTCTFCCNTGWKLADPLAASDAGRAAEIPSVSHAVAKPAGLYGLLVQQLPATPEQCPQQHPATTDQEWLRWSQPFSCRGSLLSTAAFPRWTGADPPCFTAMRASQVSLRFDQRQVTFHNHDKRVMRNRNNGSIWASLFWLSKIWCLYHQKTAFRCPLKILHFGLRSVDTFKYSY